MTCFVIQIVLNNKRSAMKKVVSKCLHYLEVLGEYAIQKYGLE